MSEVTYKESKKWKDRSDILQYTSIGLVVFGIFILEALPEETAKVAVWYWAAFTFVMATVGFIVGMISVKKMKAYLDQENERIRRIIDEVET